jgi:hypothetical protein
VKVGLTYAYPTGFGGIGPAHFAIEAFNTSDRTTTLTGVGIALPGDNNMYVVRPESVAFPRELAGGQSVSELIAVDEVCSQMRDRGLSGRVRVRGFYDNALGGKHLSKPKAIDL